MKIAILSRGRNTHPGGDVVAIDCFIRALAKQGHEAVYFDGCQCPPLNSFDVIHIHHCNFDWSIRCMQVAGNRPYVLTPLYYSGLWLENVTQVVRRASIITPFTYQEAANLERDIGPLNMPVVAIPNGSEQQFHGPDGGDGREGVMVVEMRPNSKNSLAIQLACEATGLPIRHVIGRSYEEMPALYKQSRLFVLASGPNQECMSLAVGEALCAGCRVLSTPYNYGNVWYPGIPQVDPAEAHPRPNYCNAIKTAYEQLNWDFGPNAAARKLTWDSMAETFVKIYRRLYGSH